MPNTFNLKFINFERVPSKPRRFTTCAQLFSLSSLGKLYKPFFHVLLSTNGEDWQTVLGELNATLRNASFYRDAPERSVEFGITFDFGYVELPMQYLYDFRYKAEVILNGDYLQILKCIAIEEELFELQKNLEFDYLQNENLYAEELKKLRFDIKTTEGMLKNLKERI